MSSERNDEQLEQARREIRVQAAGLHARPLLARLEPSAPLAAADDRIDRTRMRYALADLAGAHHRQFVDTAFRALLKRAPEAAEADRQLARLASGASKAELLGDLRWSPEGRRIGVQVPGLAPRYALGKARRIPLLGHLLDWGIGLAGLPLQARHLRAVETYFAARDEAARQALDAQAARIGALEAQLHVAATHGAEHAALLAQRVDDLHDHAHQLVLARDALTRALGDTESALRTRIERLEGSAESQHNRLDELEFVRQRFYAINHWTHQLDETFAHIERIGEERTQARTLRAARTALATVAADTGRAARHEAWAALLAAQVPAGARVLVLASDTEWSRLLGGHGFDVTHAEANPALAAVEREERVTHESVAARELLQRCADASIDAVGILAVTSLAGEFAPIELLDEVRRVLRAGGALLLADAPEAAALVQTLTGQAAPPVVANLLPQAFADAGFSTWQRADAADATPAWLLRCPST